jgi:hypothetical protein|tara:strand:+ start:17987 stop:18373 length:387 start_codon:yes stop_codon:yes gene_type:complete
MFVALAEGLMRLVTLLSFRLTSSFNVFVLPQKKKSRAPSTRPPIAPTTMPPIAPALKPFFPVSLGLVMPEDVAGLVEGRGDSAGNGSPGLSIYAESIANPRCLSILTLAFELMTPTIPYVMQEPGAEQ